MGKNKKLIKTCTTLAIFTSSFDIFAIVNIGGFNFRFCQLIIFPVITLYLMNVMASRRFIEVSIFTYLDCFAACILLPVPKFEKCIWILYMVDF